MFVMFRQIDQYLLLNFYNKSFSGKLIEIINYFFVYIFFTIGFIAYLFSNH